MKSWTVWAEQLGIDYVSANRLENSKRLTGQVFRDCHQGASLQVDSNQTIVMGDGANDPPMIQAAGIGITLWPSQSVKEQAPHRFKKKSHLGSWILDTKNRREVCISQ